jgi:hypothetical protein
VPAEQRIECGRAALERNARRIRLGQRLERIFGSDASRGAAEAVVEGHGFAGRKEFRQAARRIGRNNGERQAVDSREHHRSQILRRIAGISVERLVDGVAVSSEQQRVVVGCRAGDCFRGNIRRGAARFSITTEMPACSVSSWATTRANVSMPPPGAKPTMNVMARRG